MKKFKDILMSPFMRVKKFLDEKAGGSVADRFNDYLADSKGGRILVMISLRNLLRQKRRNIMLGSAMAFGVMILTIASSFSHGISDIMFNKIVTYVAGHVSINIQEGKGRMINIFRDKERLFKVVEENAKGKMLDFNEGIGIFTRAIGNGKAENMILVGVETGKSISAKERKELDESFHVEDGAKFEDLRGTQVENPVILSKEKAKVLNVGKNDIIRVRFNNIFGQTQSARLTVIGIMSNDNIFMQGVMFVELANLKQMMGYRPWECGAIQVKLKDPQKDAIEVADKIHDALKPGPAFIYASLSNGAKTTILPFMGNDDAKKEIFRKSITLVSGKIDDALSKDGVIVSDSLARSQGIYVGKKIEFRFKPKFEEKEASYTVEVKGIFASNESTGKDTIFMHEALFYPKFYESLPDLTKDSKNAFYPKSDAAFYQALGLEWVLLDRSRTTEDVTKKMRNASKKKIKAATIDVNSMYESASDVLKLEGALNLITLAAVLILFFIIIIGVINTLRMTIRERTREIGTIRAIGMQKGDVRTIFILETAFLTFFAALAGTVVAFIVMGLLSLIPFTMSDNPMGILLVKQHLYFLPTIGSVLKNMVLIIAIAIATSFFPARKAANMSAADALRHFE